MISFTGVRAKRLLTFHNKNLTSKNIVAGGQRLGLRGVSRGQVRLVCEFAESGDFGPPTLTPRASPLIFLLSSTLPLFLESLLVNFCTEP